MIGFNICSGFGTRTGDCNILETLHFTLFLCPVWSGETGYRLRLVFCGGLFILRSVHVWIASA